MEQTSFYTYIKLAADDFPLEAVTERLGVKPTKTWKVGDEVRRNLTFLYVLGVPSRPCPIARCRRCAEPVVRRI